MTPHMVRYSVKPDQAARNDELLRALFDELDRVQPAGLRYAAFRLDDGISYVHFVWMDAGTGHTPLPHLEALSAFHAGIRERCDEAPVRSGLCEMGSFRLFAGG